MNDFQQGSVLVCTTYILACDAQLWSAKAVVDDKGEGRVSSC